VNNEMSGEEMNYKDKTPSCDMHEALVAYLYDEATPEESRLVQTHLTECASCKEELHSFERVRDMLQKWQLDDLPVVRVVAGRGTGGHSMLAALKELFLVTPLWAKALGAVAAALLVFAVVGTDLSVGRDGVSFHADLFRRGRTVEPQTIGDAKNGGSLNGVAVEQVRTEVKTLVNELIAESERQQKEELRAQLVSLESQLQNMRSADLTKLAMRIQEHQQRLRTLEQDIDRREGLDLTDILFGEAGKPAERSAGSSD
jgi:Putative zinc-finger